MTSFKALWVTEENDNIKRQIIERTTADLPEGEVLIQVKYSSLNYKDVLSAYGNKGVTRVYPHQPGIDAAGIVAASSHADFREGDEVLVTGYDLGMNTAGGFGQYIRVPAAWVVSLPKNLSLREAMNWGTAGFTAALSVYKIVKREKITPQMGATVVSGATGGVGMMSVALLNKLGFEVTASSGKEDQYDLLRQIGAKEIVGRQALADWDAKPMSSARFVAGIDTVGGTALSAIMKSLKQEGVVTTCGNVGGLSFKTSVFPLILRGVNLMGITSAGTEMPLRRELWDLIAGEFRLDNLDLFTHECSLEELEDKMAQMKEGAHWGKLIVNMEG